MARRYISGKKQTTPANRISKLFSRNSSCLGTWSSLTSTNNPDVYAYLSFVILAHVIRLLVTKPPDKHELHDFVTGEWFTSNRIEGFTPLTLLCQHNEIDLVELIRLWWPVLSIDKTGTASDLFGELHHELISSNERHSSGTQFTPAWLADGIIKRLLTKHPNGRLLDPACGSGVFLIRAFERMRARSPEVNPIEHLKKLGGIDRDPLAVQLSCANMLFGLGRDRLLSAKTKIKLPITLANPLSNPQVDRSWDMIVGNPPWVTFRSLSSDEQEQLRILAKDINLESSSGHLVSHSEVATLFALVAARKFASSRASLGMIMPRSILDADHHYSFRKLVLGSSKNNTGLSLKFLWDLESVKELFSVASCVIFCDSNKHPATKKISASTLHGISPAVPTWSEAKKTIQIKSVKFTQTTIGKREILRAEKELHSLSSDSNSRYRSRFRQGATLVPRNFWFVDVCEKRGRLRKLKSIGTGKRGPTTAYSSISLSGDVEDQFLYATALGDDIVPFGIRNWRIIVLPLLNGRCIDANTAKESGFRGLANWLSVAESYWQSIRGEKAEKLSLAKRLDYRRDLTNQKLNASYSVLYPNLQRIVCSSSISKNEMLQKIQKITGITPNGFIADTAQYHLRTDDSAEAYYLAAILNAPIVDSLLEPLRNRHQRNQPNVHKRIFDVAPIPQFDAENTIHSGLSQLSSACKNRVENWLQQNPSSRSIPLSQCRNEVRLLLKNELREIDELTRRLFKL